MNLVKMLCLMTFMIFLVARQSFAEGLDSEFGSSAYSASSQSQDLNYESDPMDIGGDYAPKKQKLTASDRSRLYRQQLEKRTEQQMLKKMENIRIQQEIQMMKNFTKAMDATTKALEDSYKK